MPPYLLSFIDVMAELEENHSSILLKYLMASQVLSGHSFDMGANPFQDFATLIKMRNDIMHLKPRDSFVHSKINQAQTVEPPKYIIQLQKRGLARTPKHGSMSWLNLLQTSEIAEWACETSRSIIVSVLDLIPKHPVSGSYFDPGWGLRKTFEKK